MALEMKSGSRWWYLRYRDGKKVRQVKLQVPLRGRVPVGPDDDGDRVFRASKAEAEKEHNKVLAEIRGDPGAEKAIQRLVELKTGGIVVFPTLAELPSHWERISRRKKPNERYAKQCKSALVDFADFVHDKKPHVVQFIQVTPELAKAYMEHREADGVSSKTWNDTLKLLRATFKHLHPQVAEGQNPFGRLVTRALETVSRHPFSPEEMRKILDECAGDDFIRPIIVTGMCTAMRRGDCCLLRWEDVDMKAGFITVKTSKTGETVDIPILALFRDELQKAELARDQADEAPEYVFPAQAQMYLKNADGITLRVQRVVSKALGGPTDGETEALPELSVDETRRLGLEYIANMPNGTKANRMKAVFESYMDGKNINDVMACTEVSKGSVSGYLTELELGTGCRIIRGRHEGVSFAARMRSDKSVLHASRPNGERRASVRDFHSFRVTWITIALAAGVPLEIVQRVTGHKTVDVVLKHYFRPGREDFRRTLENAMPQLFLQSSQPKTLPAPSGAVSTSVVRYEEQMTPSAMIRATIVALEKQTGRNWKTKRDEALKALRGAAKWADSHLMHEKSTGYTAK